MFTFSKRLTFTTLLVLLINICASLLLSIKVQAAIIEKQYDRTFEVTNTFVKVRETKKINITDPNWLIPAGSKEYFTVFYPVEGDPQADEKIENTKASLRVTGVNGQELSYAFEATESKNVIISVSIPDVITQRLPTSITVEYNAYGLLVKSGNVYDVYIPGFPEDYQTTTERSNEVVNTTAIIPNNLPEINFINPQADITQEGANQVIRIPIENLKGKTNWIQLGKTQYYDFSIEQKVPKTSSLPLAMNFFTLPIPRDIQSGSTNQKVFFTDIFPTPYSIEQDIDGNVLATFRLNAHEDNTILIKGMGIVNEDSAYTFTNSGSISDVPQSMQNYLQPGEFWEVSNPDIKAAANEIKGSSTDVYEIINKTYSYVVDKIDYSYVKKYGLNERQGALATLNGGAAVCMEYSDLFITLLRAQGIPARAVFGHGFNSLEYESTNENTVNHQWAEVYVPAKQQWVSIDTTWGEFGTDLVTGDLNHFTSHVASINPENPSTTKITFIGSMPSLPEIQYTIDIKEDITDLLTIEQTARTPAQLVNEYPKKEGFQEGVDTLTFNLSVMVNFLGMQLSKGLGIQSPAVGLMLLMITLMTLIILVIFIIKTLKSRKVEMSKSENI